jgi:hypothetical protein
MNETENIETSGVFTEVNATSSDYFSATFQNKFLRIFAIASSFAALLIILPCLIFTNRLKDALSKKLDHFSTNKYSFKVVKWSRFLKIV